jgi:hypothetical protein
MMNKAINTLVLATVDSLTKFKNKFAYYLAIFAMVFGSTFGTMNSANAAALTLGENSTNATNGINANGTPATLSVAGADTVNVADFDLVVTGLDGTATAFSLGAITGTATDNDTPPTLQLILQEDAASIAQNITVASVTFTADNDTAGLIDLDSADAAGVSGSFTFTGDVDTGLYGTTRGIIDIDMENSSATTPRTTVIFGGNVSSLIRFDQNAELISITTNGTSAQTITGTLNSDGGDGEGTLNLTGTGGVTFASAVGKASNGSLLLVNIDTAATFDGAVEATNFTVDADSTFTGAVTANTAFTVAGATTDVTITAASSLGTLTATAGTITANGLLTTVNTVNTAGKIYLNVAENEMGAGKYTAGDGAELHVGKALVTTNNIFLSDVSAGEGDFHSGSKIYLPSNLTSGETLKITDAGAFDQGDADKTAVTTAAAVDVTLQDTALVNYSASAASAGATVITITATDKTASAVATELAVETNVATSMLNLMVALDANDTSGDTAAYDAFDNALNARGLTATADTDLALQVAPQTDTIGGSTVATRAMTGTVQGIVSNRMASLRSGDAYVTGMSAGNGLSANSGFIQAFGSEAEQENTGPATATVYGYDSQTSGVAIGFDGMTETGETIGLSASFSTTDVDGKGTGKSKNAIDSYTVSVYADKATDNGYIEGSLTYGINDNTSSRIVNTAGLSRTYTGNYDSQQISLKVGGGAPQEVIDGTFVTPFASATATNITTDAYTETSTTASDALRLKIVQDDINSLVGTVGVKAHMVTDNGTPMISLAINNEFGDTSINSTNTYQGGGTAFKTSTDVEELSATLGLGYSFGNDVSSVNIGYEANANEDDYLSHYGTVKIVSKF